MTALVIGLAVGATGVAITALWLLWGLRATRHTTTSWPPATDDLAATVADLQDAYRAAEDARISTYRTGRTRP